MTGPGDRIVVVTYCSRDKDHAPGLLPAVDRYLSPRIRAAAATAAHRGHDFRILSGLYGLLAPDHLIPDYDHLLTADQVAEHARKVARNLGDLGVSRVVYFTRSAAVDPGCGAYGEVMRRACGRAGLEFIRREITAANPEPEDLANLI